MPKYIAGYYHKSDDLIPGIIPEYIIEAEDRPLAEHIYLSHLTKVLPNCTIAETFRNGYWVVYKSDQSALLRALCGPVGELKND